MAGLSKYIIAIAAVFYTFQCFAVFSYRHDEDRRVFYVFQLILLFMTHVMGFYVLYVRSEDPRMMLLGALEGVFFILIVVLFKLLYPAASVLITHNICMLMTIGFVMLARLSFEKAVRQFIMGCIALAVALVIPSLMRYIYRIRHYYWAAGIAGIAALLAMLTKGTVTNGSKISLTFFGLTFLPSDFIKLLFIFFVAGMLTDEDHRDPLTGRVDRQQMIASVIIAASHVGVLTLCKDLGSALLYFVIYVFMLYTALRAPAVLLGGAGAMVVASLAGYRLFAHVRNRVRAFMDPFLDIEGNGYQVAQSLFAIGTGGWFGLGLMAGSPGSIPEVSKDFMFAAISEEMGGLVAICVILISLSNFLMFMNISMAIEKTYLRLMAVGLAVSYGFQVILTIGGVTKFIPLTGITLPLVSYGGSSLMSTLVTFSLIQGLYILEGDGEEGIQDIPYPEEDETRYEKAERYKEADRYEDEECYGDRERYTERYKEHCKERYKETGRYEDEDRMTEEQGMKRRRPVDNSGYPGGRGRR